MIFISAEMPSSMYVKARFCVPPSTSWIGSPAHDVAEELRDHARAAFLRGVDGIQPRADPVERPERA
jgi:hypothetical protein